MPPKDLGKRVSVQSKRNKLQITHSIHSICRCMCAKVASDKTQIEICSCPSPDPKITIQALVVEAVHIERALLPVGTGRGMIAFKCAKSEWTLIEIWALGPEENVYRSLIGLQWLWRCWHGQLLWMRGSIGKDCCILRTRRVWNEFKCLKRAYLWRNELGERGSSESVFCKYFKFVVSTWN